jgi:lipid II:glycine glycyltransferase (peptidoglycan interpeptide bridge formation enzyme)
MLLLKRKVGPFVVQHKHNYDKISYADAFRLTFYYRLKIKRKYFGFIQKDYYTIDNKLDKSVEEIFKGYTSTVKNEIRRSERENVKVGLIDSIDEFRNFHNSFAIAKGIPNADEELLTGYQTNLLITSATFENRIISAHAYIIDKHAGITRLLFSSSIRLYETADINFIGRANKYLHYKDMEYFKTEGFLIYDFGGYAYNTTEIQRLGINKFKKSFGGEIVRYSDYQSFLYWLSSIVFYTIRSLKRLIIHSTK